MSFSADAREHSPFSPNCPSTAIYRFNGELTWTAGRRAARRNRCMHQGDNLFDGYTSWQSSRLGLCIDFGAQTRPGLPSTSAHR